MPVRKDSDSHDRRDTFAVYTLLGALLFTVLLVGITTEYLLVQVFVAVAYLAGANVMGHKFWQSFADVQVHLRVGLVIAWFLASYIVSLFIILLFQL